MYVKNSWPVVCADVLRERLGPMRVTSECAFCVKNGGVRVNEIDRLGIEAARHLQAIALTNFTGHVAPSFPQPSLARC